MKGTETRIQESVQVLAVWLNIDANNANINSLDDLFV